MKKIPFVRKINISYAFKTYDDAWRLNVLESFSFYVVKSAIFAVPGTSSTVPHLVPVLKYALAFNVFSFH